MTTTGSSCHLNWSTKPFHVGMNEGDLGNIGCDPSRGSKTYYQHLWFQNWPQMMDESCFWCSRVSSSHVVATWWLEKGYSVVSTKSLIWIKSWAAWDHHACTLPRKHQQRSPHLRWGWYHYLRWGWYHYFLQNSIMLMEFGLKNWYI